MGRDEEGVGVIKHSLQRTNRINGLQRIKLREAFGLTTIPFRNRGGAGWGWGGEGSEILSISRFMPWNDNKRRPDWPLILNGDFLPYDL